MKTSVYKLIIELIKPNWIKLLKALTLSIFYSLLEGFSASLVMPIFNSLGSQTTPLNLPSSSFLQIITNFYNEFPEKWRLVVVTLSFLLITVIKNLSRYLSNIDLHELHLNAGLELRKKCVERFLQLDILFHNQSKVGQLLTYVNEHVQRSEVLVANALHMGRDSLTVLILLLLLISISPTLTLVTFGSLILVALLLRFVIKYVQFYGRKAANSIEEFSCVITEIISGIRVVKGFNSEFRELERAEESLQERHKTELSAYKYSTAVAPLTETLGIAALLVILVIGSNLLAGSQTIAIPILLTYTFALLRILPKVTHINNLRSQYSLLSGSLESIQNFLASTEGLHLPDGSRLHKTMQSGLIFENVTFTFPNNPESTLKAVSFRIPKGKMTAIVGPSGSGKSTLVDLVMRFYDPNDGSIKVDDIALPEFQINSWRQSIAMVSQDTFLFNASVRDNILYSRPDATEVDVIEAAKKAYAYEFIQNLPQRFDTILGNRGMKLSGGQRQRIAIARAILRNPDLLILDEATSALDTNSERIVQKAIEEVSNNRTVIVIAHRLSTIENADNIVVLCQGKVVEQGTHQELLVLQGEYHSLYQSQVLSESKVAQNHTLD